jgi:hypothetical protein
MSKKIKDKNNLLNKKGKKLVALFGENYELNKEKNHKEFNELLLKICRSNYKFR